MKKALLIIGIVLLLFAMNGVFADSKEIKATAEIISCTSSEPIGKAILTERRSDEGVKLVDITVIADDLSQGKHGVHIHEVGDCTPCADAGGHFDPGPSGNSSPDGNHPFHTGDLVNLEVRGNGSGVMHTTTSRITLSAGPLSVFDGNGSAIVVHVNPDTYCPSGSEAGCAGGARAACGVIVAD
ncbi:MAG TPA: superoxide dismutase family protein [Acidobacteriota bacterium]|nr:superoxide dismutase family protein [Acidobacteriota bacterium]